MTYDRDLFYHALLHELGAPTNENNVRALTAWGECEGSAAQYNPLDTTQEAEGATEYNSFDSNGVTLHVWNYPDEATGVHATAETLRNGHYTHILTALHDGSGNIVGGDARSEMRVWGTNPDCIARKLQTAPPTPTQPEEPPAHTVPERPLTVAQREQFGAVLRHLHDRFHPLPEGDHVLVQRIIKQAQRVVKL